MRCDTGHGVVGATGSQAQHVHGMLWESWGHLVGLGRSCGASVCAILPLRFGLRGFGSIQGQ